MSVTVKIDGLREIEAALEALGDEAVARRVGRAAVKKALEPMQERAKAMAPDDPATGVGKHLRESIKVGSASASRVNRGQEIVGDKEDQVWAVLGIDQNVDPPKDVPRKSGDGTYRDPGVAGVATIIEFGREGVPAVPFMRSAWDSGKDALPRLVAAAIKPKIEAAAKRLARKRARARQ